MSVYYNEVEPYAAQTLRNLIAAGEIPAGDVDERDIRDVKPSNLDGYTQCHFFAGVGIWAMALRAAGWRDDQPIWTGSCPCQPLSAAGKGLGFDDERHLWPDWYWLIEQCRPQAILGEQVASNDGLKWADLVQADLEAADYAFGPVDTCAAGFGGYHIRQRLYFASIDNLLADTSGQHRRLAEGREWQQVLEDIWRGADDRLGDHKCAGLERYSRNGHQRAKPRRQHTNTDRSIAPTSHSDGMADASGSGRPSGARLPDQDARCGRHEPADDCSDHRSSAIEMHGAAADWLHGRDGKWRPVRPGSFPLADASPGRAGQLHAIGNGLDLAQATAACRAFMERNVDQLDAAPAHDLFEWSA
ncbi:MULTISPECIES: DNA cytosine methyltransferase [unclassified Sulfitobacter]|uniref:DNA cytosine methyltransferase n=1 Tax=unclassified Sulfitobacter TaxID=196795 RepID=UPI0023E12FC8|nr:MULTISPECIES: DNA cytosine methyltransferase [unclassified Sulfitobacter]